tara:strand:- start:201 stop:404 length:204 start_codon:yes stop_codon:yes gene_type:complete
LKSFITAGHADIINDSVTRIYEEMIYNRDVKEATKLLDAIEKAIDSDDFDDLQDIILQNSSPPGTPA